MKRLLVLMSCVLLAGGCSMIHGARPVPMQASVQAAPAPAPGLVDVNGAPIERVAFVTGRSSATVEKMAKLRGCTGGQGAGLMTPEGPVEVYKMRCENGRSFTARCELRQCKAM